MDVGLHLLRDGLGTAEGYCLRCGAYLSITVPADQPAADELLKLFERHLTEKHPVFGECREK